MNPSNYKEEPVNSFQDPFHIATIFPGSITLQNGKQKIVLGFFPSLAQLQGMLDCSLGKINVAE